jgi:hypothetical protein
MSQSDRRDDTRASLGVLLCFLKEFLAEFYILCALLSSLLDSTWRTTAIPHSRNGKSRNTLTKQA